MISYQMFTQTAVTTVLIQVNMLWPSVGAWLSSRIDMIVFVYAFAWVFLLSSVIPSVILGKGRSVLVQFIVCLTLTLLAFVFQDALTAHATKPLADLLYLAFLFQNPILAIGYLSMPYILMLILDLNLRRKNHENEKLETIEPTRVQDTYVENPQLDEREMREGTIPAE
jgi:hypothetical protein